MAEQRRDAHGRYAGSRSPMSMWLRRRETLVSFHGLRHTSASIVLAGGVPLMVVSRQLGHARVDVTAQTYAHLLSDADLDQFSAAHGDASVASDCARGRRRRRLAYEAG